MIWTVRRSNFGEGEIFCTCPARLCDSPSLLYSGYRVFPGVKRTGRLVDYTHLPPRLKKEYSYTSSPSLGLHGLLQGELYIVYTLNIVMNG